MQQLIGMFFQDHRTGSAWGSRTAAWPRLRSSAVHQYTYHYSFSAPGSDLLLGAIRPLQGAHPPRTRLSE
eukprot:9749291-Heterocapsa_arctica.AAC.1